MNFIFISPNFPKTYYQFCRELKNLGVNVLGIGEDPYDCLSNELKDSLSDYYQVRSLENYADVYQATAYFAYRYGKIDYIESNNEYWLESDARLRSDFDVCTGKKSEEIQMFKSKEAMKEYYRKAGIKVARYHIPTTLEKAREFIGKVGYPVIVKPDNGVGAYHTYKINNDSDLIHFYEKNFPSVKYIMEEYIDGDLISFDGISNQECEPVFFSNEVFPTPIMELVNKLSDVFYYSNNTCPKDLEEAGRKVLKSFEARNRYFHLEFFRLKKDKVGLGKKGDLIGLEVNMRCPGGYTPDMINFANSVSTYRIWAEVMVSDRTDENLNLPHFYCGYYGRRIQNRYGHTREDIFNRFGDKIVMHEWMPEILSGAMGNEAFYLKTDSMDELIEFRDFCSK